MREASVSTRTCHQQSRFTNPCCHDGQPSKICGGEITTTMFLLGVRAGHCDAKVRVDFLTKNRVSTAGVSCLFPPLGSFARLRVWLSFSELRERPQSRPVRKGLREIAWETSSSLLVRTSAPMNGSMQIKFNQSPHVLKSSQIKTWPPRRSNTLVIRSSHCVHNGTSTLPLE